MDTTGAAVVTVGTAADAAVAAALFVLVVGLHVMLKEWCA